MKAGPDGGGLSSMPTASDSTLEQRSRTESGKGTFVTVRHGFCLMARHGKPTGAGRVIVAFGRRPASVGSVIIRISSSLMWDSPPWPR
jgi:hypothetical protein